MLVGFYFRSVKRPEAKNLPDLKMLNCGFLELEFYTDLCHMDKVITMDNRINNIIRQIKQIKCSILHDEDWAIKL